MKNEIFKIQIPLVASKGGEYDVLVYNEDRSIMNITKVRSKSERDILMDELGGESKGYFYGYIDKKGGLILTKRANEQVW